MPSLKMLHNVCGALGSKGDDSAGKTALITLSPGPAGQRPFYSGGLVPPQDGVTCGRPRTAAARDGSEAERKSSRKKK